MEDPTSSRTSPHVHAIQKLRLSIDDCEKCEGTGTDREIPDFHLLKELLRNPGKRINIGNLEGKHAKKRKKQAFEHAKSKRENPTNSSYGLCRCRIKVDAKRELLIGDFPLEIMDIKNKDIISRDVSLHGRNIDVKNFIKFYTKQFQPLKRDSIGCNFFGGPGCGKTLIAQLIAYRIAKKRYSIHILQFIDLIDLNNTNLRPRQLLFDILATDLLIIDNIGHEQAFRRKACSELSHMFRERSRKKKVTFFIFSDLKKKAEILEEYGHVFQRACTENNMNVVFKTSISDDRTSKAKLIKHLRKAH